MILPKNFKGNIIALSKKTINAPKIFNNNILNW